MISWTRSEPRSHLLLLDLHADCRQVRVGEQAVDEARDQAGLPDAEPSEHADFLLNHRRDPPGAAWSDRITRNDTASVALLLGFTRVHCEQRACCRLQGPEGERLEGVGRKAASDGVRTRLAERPVLLVGAIGVGVPEQLDDRLTAGRRERIVQPGEQRVDLPDRLDLPGQNLRSSPSRRAASALRACPRAADAAARRRIRSAGRRQSPEPFTGCRRSTVPAPGRLPSAHRCRRPGSRRVEDAQIPRTYRHERRVQRLIGSHRLLDRSRRQNRPMPQTLADRRRAGREAPRRRTGPRDGRWRAPRVPARLGGGRARRPSGVAPARTGTSTLRSAEARARPLPTSGDTSRPAQGAGTAQPGRSPGSAGPRRMATNPR